MINLKKSGLFLLIICIITISAIYLVKHASGSNTSNSAPRITELGRFGARISWNSSRPVVGEIVLRTGNEAETVVREKIKTTHHSIDISGLLPETIYNYRLAGSSDQFFTFKTAPLTETAFRLMVDHRPEAFSPKNADNFTRAVNTLLPDFVILTGQLATKDFLPEEKAFFQGIKAASRIPIYLAPAREDLKNPDSGEYFLTVMPVQSNGYDYAFDYGNSRFIILGPDFTEDRAAAYPKRRSDWFRETVSRENPLHIFIIWPSLTTPANSDQLLLDAINDFANQGIITALISSVKIPDRSLAAGLKNIAVNRKCLTVDVDGAGVTGTLSGEDDSEFEVVTIQETPEAVKRSCIYCRKLLDTQRYQESIDWYRKFIRQFGGKYTIDDAQFEIANIYDQYLYDYPDAIREYQTLIDQYPDSGKARQATHRIEYLKAYADYNFQPLQIFEKAKAQTYQHNKMKAVAEIASILNRYPGAKIEGQVLLWLGYTLTESDLDRATSYFRRMIDSHPDPKSAEEAWVAWGDAYYFHKQYSKAIEAYNSAQKISANQFNFALQDKIRKSQRDIIRDLAFVIILIILALSYAAALLIKPRWLSLRELQIGGALWVAYLGTGLICWVLFCRNYPELAIFIPILTLGATSVPLCTIALSRKIFYRHPRVFAAISTLVLSVFLLYAILYFYQIWQHYLPAFGI
jgi:tetratricopeptide (TPR) repeat protein